MSSDADANPTQLKRDFDRIVRKWKPQSDVFVYRWSTFICGGLGAVTGFYATRHYRKLMQLKSLARIVTYLPPMYFAAMCGVFNLIFVQYPLLQREANCPLCMTLRSTLIQTTFGSVLPLVTAVISTTHYAAYYSKYPLADNFLLNKEAFKYNWKIVKELSVKRNAHKKFLVLFLANVAFGYFVAFEQQMCVFRVMSKLRTKMERETQRKATVGVKNTEMLNKNG